MRHPPVIEVKRKLDGSEQTFPCEGALVQPGRRAVLVYLLDRPWEVADLPLRPGMRTFAHYWIDRPYNVYHWLEGARTVGHYFNVGACAEISTGRVVWTDYEVDVLVRSDGTALVLDEDELAAVTDRATLDLVAATRRHILANVTSLVREVETETRRIIAIA